jgi:hypothetical protein
MSTPRPPRRAPHVFRSFVSGSTPRTPRYEAAVLAFQALAAKIPRTMSSSAASYAETLLPTFTRRSAASLFPPVEDEPNKEDR